MVLRLVLGEESPLAVSGALDDGVTSALLEVECLRTLDRLRLAHPEQAEELSETRAALFAIVGALSVVEINRTVLERASLPLPLPRGTLDAIHLSTASIYRDRQDGALAFATHDERLGLAARALGFEVLGV